MNTLGEEFQLCKPELLLEVLLDTQFGWELNNCEMGTAARSSLISKLESTLSLMESISRTSSRRLSYPQEPKRLSVIIPWEWFSLSELPDEFVRHLDARILNCNSISGRKAIDGMFLGKISDVSELKEALRCRGNMHPFLEIQEKGIVRPVDALMNVSWASALAYKVWLPKSLCERERYCVIANAFWAMTYNGFYPFEEKECLKYIKPDFTNESRFASESKFNEDYRSKMEDLMDLLNYNCWVDVMHVISYICKAK